MGNLQSASHSIAMLILLFSSKCMLKNSIYQCFGMWTDQLNLIECSKLLLFGKDYYCVEGSWLWQCSYFRKIQDMGYTSKEMKARREAMKQIMVKYLETRDCRRRFILNHFEGAATSSNKNKNCCDNCTRKWVDVTM